MQLEVLQGLVPIVNAVGHQASSLILAGYGKAQRIDTKSDHTPVTETDRAVNAMVIDALGRATPEYPVLGEEESSVTTLGLVKWVVDPLDGTNSFITGVPTFTFALALVEDGKPVMATIVHPMNQWFMVAVRGSGVTLNGQRISAESRRVVSDERVEVGLSPTSPYQVPNIYGVLGRQGFATVTFGSVSFAAIQVARGFAAGCITAVNSPWDGAAAKLIVEEAGGKVTNLYGDDQRYDGPLTGLIMGSSESSYSKLLASVRAQGVELNPSLTSGDSLLP